jgi:hypothetical protein
LKSIKCAPKACLSLIIFASAVLAAAKGVSAAAPDSVDSIIWQEPANIESRELFYGSGGPERMPQPPFVFLKEDMHGTNPKFSVVDANGVKWKVKMGIEARPEVAASRLVWAVGYFTRDFYLIPKMKVENLPPHLKRGRQYIASDGTIANARLKRMDHHDGKAEIWKWRSNPFENTKEFNGLRVLMALINNLDIKDENNEILRKNSRNIYIVTDLGSSFSARLWPPGKKGNLKSYKRSKFIRKINAKTIDVNIPTGPAVYDPYHLGWSIGRIPSRWFGRNIPRSDAAWIGGMLARLSPNQIRDAFRAGGYSTEEIEGFTQQLLERIEQLNKL